AAREREREQDKNERTGEVIPDTRGTGNQARNEACERETTSGHQDRGSNVGVIRSGRAAGSHRPSPRGIRLIPRWHEDCTCSGSVGERPVFGWPTSLGGSPS